MCNLLLVFTIVGAKNIGLEGTDTLSRMTQSLENISHVKVHEKIVSITLSQIIVCGDKCVFNNKVHCSICYTIMNGWWENVTLILGHF